MTEVYTAAGESFRTLFEPKGPCSFYTAERWRSRTSVVPNFVFSKVASANPRRAAPFVVVTAWEETDHFADG
jgi:hypothetical protein